MEDRDRADPAVDERQPLTGFTDEVRGEQRSEAEQQEAQPHLLEHAEPAEEGGDPGEGGDGQDEHGEHPTEFADAGFGEHPHQGGAADAEGEPERNIDGSDIAPIELRAPEDGEEGDERRQEPAEGQQALEPGLEGASPETPAKQVGPDEDHEHDGPWVAGGLGHLDAWFEVEAADARLLVGGEGVVAPVVPPGCRDQGADTGEAEGNGRKERAAATLVAEAEPDRRGEADEDKTDQEPTAAAGDGIAVGLANDRQPLARRR